jgi:hypothetical protein
MSFAWFVFILIFICFFKQRKKRGQKKSLNLLLVGDWNVASCE